MPAAGSKGQVQRTWVTCSPGSRLSECSAAMGPPRPLRCGAGKCARHSSLPAVAHASQRPSLAASGSSSAASASSASLPRSEIKS